MPRKVKKDNCDVFISLYQCPTVIARESAAADDRGNPVPINSGLLRFTRNDIKHIMVVHDIIPKLFPEYLNNFRKKLYWNLTEKALASADKIIAVSHRTEKDLIQHLGIAPEKISVNYIDCDGIYKKPAGTKHASSVLKKCKLKSGYIFTGGGLEVRKNIEGVIRAYKIIYAKNKQEKFVKEFPKLVISGKLLPQLAPLATDAEKLVKELNLTKQVKLLDFVPQADLPALYQNALMFVYPSHYEGFGLPVLEAMSQGVPIITAKTSSLPEVGGDSVLYCNPDDIEDIAMVMKNIMLNKNLRETLSQRAKERAKNFSWEKFTEKILYIISNFQ